MHIAKACMSAMFQLNLKHAATCRCSEPLLRQSSNCLKTEAWRTPAWRSHFIPRTHCISSSTQAAQTHTNTDDDDSHPVTSTNFEIDLEARQMVPEQLPQPGNWTGMVAHWPQQTLEPALYIVATPIGNLGDITLRALSILSSVNLVLAEDTRHSRKLLTHFGIRAAVLSCHEHNERARIPGLLRRLQEGEPMALVSDAGTPGISDPGSALIQAAIQQGVRVIPVPGACAFVSALVASGLHTSRFTFIGFLPPKQGARRAALESLRGMPTTLAFYASPHALRATLADMCAVLGGHRRVCVARELTKKHEEFIRTDLQGALQVFTEKEPRGEFCLIVEGADEAFISQTQSMASSIQNATPQIVLSNSSINPDDSAQTGSAAEAADVNVDIMQQALHMMTACVAEGISRPDAAKTVAKRLKLKKKDLYALYCKTYPAAGT